LYILVIIILLKYIGIAIALGTLVLIIIYHKKYECKYNTKEWYKKENEDLYRFIDKSMKNYKKDDYERTCIIKRD